MWDPREMDCEDGMELAQDRAQRRASVLAMLLLRVLLPQC
jgi:hypothetical protein